MLEKSKDNPRNYKNHTFMVKRKNMQLTRFQARNLSIQQKHFTKLNILDDIPAYAYREKTF
ncbi:hypothetical protein CQA44_08945 [Helicobacter sp. MIT 14-3879]|nr:hypothetical protein CQA44_08945 [Helicobacter sp. MIT 14-3879]